MELSENSTRLNRRLGLFLVSLVSVVSLLVLPAGAPASFTIGATLDEEPNNEFFPVPGGSTLSQASLDTAATASDGLVSPVDGVIVKWRMKAFLTQSTPNDVALQIIRPGGSSGQVTGAGTSSLVIPFNFVVSEFSLSPGLALQVGDGIGLNFPEGHSAAVAVSPGAGDMNWWFPALTDGDPFRPPDVIPSGRKLLLQAVVELDADGDGFGDETQDLCPTDPSTQGPCLFDFTGFFSPVDNLPEVNVVKAGSAVPVKFSLGGDEGLDIFAAGYPKSEEIICGASDETDGNDQTASAGGRSLSYDPDSDQYNYVWKTRKEWSGSCRQLVVKFTDGTSHRANFQFK